jgi:hypothetical protein
MFTNDGYALLIGVDDYSTFDISRGLPVGTHDLHGSRNDVRTFWRLCRLIGIKPANIRVLTSPPFSAGELEGASSENVAPATEAEILAKTAWLAEKLAQAGKPTGVLTYSGHGDWLAGKGLVLCPSDVTAGAAGEADFAHAVSFRALNALLAAHAENLTVVLDTCHSGTTMLAERQGGRGKVAKPLALTRRRLADLPGVRETGHAPELEELAGRVLAAARRDQIAYQSLFDGYHRGVFSWAISAAIEQWRATQEDSTHVCVGLSYAKLVETAERLLSALSFEQKPQLFGPPGVEALAVLHHGTVAQPGETSDLPDAVATPEQIDPGYFDYVIYTLLDANANVLGQVLVTATANGSYAANTEYWYMTTNLSNNSAITITAGTSQYWSNPPTGLGTLSFSTTRTPTWTSGTAAGVMLAYSNVFTGEFDGMHWQMTESGGVWSGQITWWSNWTGNLFGAGVSRTLVPTRASGTKYYFVTAPL